jgi:hypothetical protein
MLATEHTGARPQAGPGAASSALEHRLAELEALSLEAIRVEWRKLFHSEPPQLSRDLILRAVAYRIQEMALGGPSPATLRRITALVRDLKAGREMSVEAGPVVRPGARLVREWRGRTHTVTVLEEGCSYGGETYPSLTAVAQKITGAHWSGPRFFGLLKKRGGQGGAGRPQREGL